MAKSALDAAILTEYVLNEGARSKLPKGGYAGSMADNFEGLKIGFADPAAWYWPENLQPKHGDSENEMVRHCPNLASSLLMESRGQVTCR